MEKLTTRLIGILLYICFSASPVFATIVNPNSTLFYDNTHTQLFMPSNSVLSIEIGDNFGLPGVNGGIGSMFGFFFANNPANPIAIFDAFDQSYNGSSATAIIDFYNGIIYDGTDGHGLRYFGGHGPIGFFLTLDPLDLDPNIPKINLYSVPEANPAGYEAFSAFPAIDNPNLFLLAFDLPGTQPLVVELVGNMTALPTSVPEPATIVLLGVGLTAVAVLRRKSLKS